uniref:ADP-ribosylhydrolase ARH1 n=2 Tax=Eptatretus burgeri TaxID=7764 RepID=A0A8C4WYV9_EPTBU
MCPITEGDSYKKKHRRCFYIQNQGNKGDQKEAQRGRDSRLIYNMAEVEMGEVTEEHYMAAMLLSAAGDALGYKNSSWEFCVDGVKIHDELKTLGGLNSLCLEQTSWPVSDDTVMHLATGEAMVDVGQIEDFDELEKKLYPKIADYYKKCMGDMFGRAPGMTSVNWIPKLQPNISGGLFIPFNPKGGGCGAAMRAMAIGLRFPVPQKLEWLIAVAVESGRMSHHHPTGYLGAVAAAFFTSLAVQRVPPRSWGAALLGEALPAARRYVQQAGRYVQQNLDSWPYFETKWRDYLELRGISDGCSEPIFPVDEARPSARDAFYASLSFSGWGGSSGHDIGLIAYDAILAAGPSWKELCLRAALHGGDSDSTGSLAGCLWGAMYGLKSIPQNHYSSLEYRSRLENVGRGLFAVARKDRYK